MTVAVGDVPPPPEARAVAARLAKTQPAPELDSLFVELPDDPRAPGVETRACLLGELALLGAGAGRPRVDAYAERLRALGHPLAWLPGSRLDIEHRFMVRVRGLGSVKTPRQLRARFPEAPSGEAGADAGRLAVEVPHLDAVSRTPDHRWLRFLASTPWFHHDTADLGLAVLDASRTRVAVLAATDTDVMASDASAQP
ncbi:DUF6183 family protein [Streptomyces cellulosae]|nr:DUF6183 family protein [Streptomyces cellulosae]